VDQKSVLVKQGYVPPIHDFTIDTEDDGDVTEEFLDDKGYTFLIISYDLSKVNFNDQKREKITDLNAFALKNGYNMYLLTASVDEDIQNFRNTVSQDIVVGLTDKITLKTIIRYNPGVVLVKDGVIRTGLGGGLNPRTCIGQTADGTILLMVLEGRKPDSMGATYDDIAQLMYNYGAVNAANLDGGSSSLMYYNGEQITRGSNIIGMRQMSTAILVLK
jgi:exopolysaccharide biosynthesis protein